MKNCFTAMVLVFAQANAVAASDFRTTYRIQSAQSTVMTRIEGGNVARALRYDGRRVIVPLNPPAAVDFRVREVDGGVRVVSAFQTSRTLSAAYLLKVTAIMQELNERLARAL